MLNKTVKVAALVGALVATPASFAGMGMGGMGGGMGMGGFGMNSFSGATVLTSNGVMVVNSARGFSSDDFRSVSATVMPSNFSGSDFDGDDVRVITTVPAAATLPATTTAVPTVINVRGEAFESRRFRRGFR